MKLDDLLSSADAAAAAMPAGQLRATLLAELELPAPRTWKSDVVLLVGSCWAFAVVIGAVMLGAGAASPAHLLARAVPIGALLLVGACCAFTALAPRRPGQVLAGLAVGAMGAAGLVLARGNPGMPASAPAWLCTASHLAVGAAPLVFAMMLLKKSAITAARALSIGLSIGTLGAIVGELACEQNWMHVAVWHLGAWLGLGLIAVLASRRITPRSFAP